MYNREVVKRLTGMTDAQLDRMDALSGTARQEYCDALEKSSKQAVLLASSGARGHREEIVKTFLRMKFAQAQRAKEEVSDA